MKRTGRFRSINRKRLSYQKLEKELLNPKTFRYRVFHEYLDLISIRQREKCFNSSAAFKVLDIDKRCFVFKRSFKNKELICVTNVTDKTLKLNLTKYSKKKELKDIVSSSKIDIRSITLEPYGFYWLKA